MDAFRIRVEDSENDMPGKICIEFMVPKMWFAFYQPLNPWWPRERSKEDSEAFKYDVIRRFADMIIREVESSWPTKE